MSLSPAVGLPVLTATCKSAFSSNCVSVATVAACSAKNLTVETEASKTFCECCAFTDPDEIICNCIFVAYGVVLKSILTLALIT